MNPERYIPIICEETFGFLVETYGFSMRTRFWGGLKTVFRSRRTWVRIEFEERDDMFFVSIVPAVLGVPMFWRRIDLASVVEYGGCAFEPPACGIWEVPRPETARRTAEYFAHQLRRHADDMLRGDFRRLQEARAYHRRTIERQIHERMRQERDELERWSRRIEKRRTKT